MLCTFCGKKIPRGSDLMFVKKDGKTIHFCSLKCKKNMLKLKRSGKKTKWTEYVRTARERQKNKKKK